jgi:hypothetical protein
MLKGLKRIDIFGGKIYHLFFEDKVNMCKAFLRFQEYHDNVNFKGKVFTLNEFTDWYKVYRKEETFTYYNDWAGFNIPDTALKPFFNGDMNPLDELEEKFLNLFKFIDGKYYILGTCDGAESGQAALEHELAHAMFYLFDDYRDRATAIIQGVDTSCVYDLFTKELSYNESVLIDETNAYLAVDSSLLKDYLVPYDVDIKHLEPTMIQLTELFHEYRLKILPDRG